MKFKTIIIWAIFIQYGCVNNSDKIKRYSLFDDPDYSSIIVENKIINSKLYYFHLNTNKQPQWKRLQVERIFNEHGLVQYELTPLYHSQKIESNSEGGIDELFSSYNQSKTNIPTGQIDTTKYFYDEQNNIIKQEFHNGLILMIKYDHHNNEIERCVTSANGETSCFYHIYGYMNDRMISKKDSFGPSSLNRRRFSDLNSNLKNIYYKYDDNGRIIQDGNYHRKFDSKGRLCEVLELLNDSTIGDHHIFNYDNRGNRALSIHIRVLGSMRDIKTDITTVSSRDTVYTNYLFNELNLPIEIKELNSKNKLNSLQKIEYLKLEK